MAAAKSSDSPLPKLVQYALKGIPHEVINFPDTMRDAEEIAAFLQIPAGQVFKTLVAIRPDNQGKPYLAIIPADGQLNLKALAKAANEKKLVMASHTQAEQLTGLQVGGISALALKNRGFKVYLDQSAQQYPHICVSGGQRGLDVKLSVSDLLRLTAAQLADLIS